MKKICLISILTIVLLFAFGLLGCGTTIDNNIVCEKCAIANGEYTVDGEFILPNSGTNLPAVVIVGGSGGIDMDGATGNQKPYKRIADGLADKGIASIRFNKVTFQHAQSVATKIDFTVDDEYFYAIKSCIEKLKSDSRIDKNKIFLIGHSLGAQIVPIVLENDSSLAGGIIMAGTTMHIVDLIMEQISKQNQAQYAEYLPYAEYAKSLTAVPPGEEHRYYFGAYSAYYVSYNKLNRNAICDINSPLLIMQGGLDLQVPISHFENYKTQLNGKTNVIFKLYENLNHIFSDGSGETLANAYTQKRQIPNNVIDDISEFILR